MVTDRNKVLAINNLAVEQCRELNCNPSQVATRLINYLENATVQPFIDAYNDGVNFYYRLLVDKKVLAPEGLGDVCLYVIQYINLVTNEVAFQGLEKGKCSTDNYLVTWTQTETYKNLKLRIFQNYNLGSTKLRPNKDSNGYVIFSDVQNNTGGGGGGYTGETGNTGGGFEIPEKGNYTPGGQKVPATSEAGMGFDLSSIDFSDPKILLIGGLLIFGLYKALS